MAYLWLQKNWKIVLVFVVLLLAVVAVYVGVTAALAAAGTLGTGVGLAYRQAKREQVLKDAAVTQTGIEEALERVDTSSHVLAEEELAADARVAAMTSREKTELGNDLLGED